MNISECHVVETVEKLSVWHDNLVHQNIKQVEEVPVRSGVEFIKDTEDFICEKSSVGKQHRFPFPDGNRLAFFHCLRMIIQPIVQFLMKHNLRLRRTLKNLLL